MCVCAGLPDMIDRYYFITYRYSPTPRDSQRSPAIPHNPSRPQPSPAIPSHPQLELAIYLLNYMIITQITLQLRNIFAHD